jgi:eukaryotic-like serine/threonine-protein kinase
MIELRTLGGLDLRDSDGQEIRPILAQPKRLALLIYLALTPPPSFRRRDSIIALFWPELDQEHARGSLRQALRFLRRTLGEGVIVSRGEEEIGVRSSILWCDATTFEQACRSGDVRQAMDLYRDDFLTGFFVSDAAVEFEQWILDERMRFRRQAGEAAWGLALSSRAAGDEGAAAEWARRALRYAPNDEGAVRRLIDLLDTLGDRAGAIEAYEEFAGRVALEFEAEPSIETRQLIETVRARSWPDRTSLHARPAAPAEEAGGGESPDAAASVETAADSHDGWSLRRPGRTLVLLAAVGLVAIGGYLAAFSRPDPRALELNADLVAIAPFDVFDSTLAFWREGLVDVLSRDLDGAGPLRTVPQTVALRRWRGRGDRGSAEAFGRSTGAGVVAFGSLLRRGRDSVTLRATLVDRARKGAEPDLEVSGEGARLGELADSLGIEILRALGRTRPIGAVRQVTIGSRSMPALKAFLLGEQFYRRGLWDSALVAYDRAIARDSGFTLAHRRMGMVLGWYSPTWRTFEPADSYTHHAARQNHGLPVRDSLLIAAAALDLTADNASNGDSLLAYRKKAWAIFDTAARRFPGDPEVWYSLGESRSHYQSPWTPAPALDAFERSLALDPRFGPAYEHTIQLAIQMGNADQARRYAAAYLELNPSGAGTEEVRLTKRMLDPVLSPSAETDRAIATASAGALFRTALEHLGSWPDTAETSIRLLRELATGRHDTAGTAPWVADPQMWLKYLAGALAFRGHLKAAFEAYEPLVTNPDTNSWTDFADPLPDLALLGVVPSGYDAQIFRKALRTDGAWSANPYFTEVYLLGLPWYLAKGDIGSLARYAQRAEAAGRHPDSPILELRSRYLGGAAKAYLTLARGDSAGALRAFQRLPEDLCVVNACSFQKLTEARLLRARGENRAAGALMDRWLWSLGASPIFVLGTLERGHIGEELGDRKKAAQAYRFVADVWRRADPELEPYVTDARAGLARLSGVGLR